jgi:cellulose synthase/poly-beta-1,6-N-acetylglucosamine synthase-like glycosyltransferase
MKPGVSVVVGPTRPPKGSRPPFFSHFMHVEKLDGTFSTCNAFYRTEALVGAGGFDPRRTYCEDLDLGWRVEARGGTAVYAPGALVYHQIIKQTALEWLRWPGKLETWPACISRQPRGRRYLYARYWVSPSHAALTAAVAGLVAAPVFPPALLLLAPYAINFADRYKFKGKWGFAKALLNLWWDLWGWLTLARSSLRHRTLVL